MPGIDVTDKPVKLTMLDLDNASSGTSPRSWTFQVKARSRVHIGEFPHNDPPVPGRDEKNALTINPREGSTVALPGPRSNRNLLYGGTFLLWPGVTRARKTGFLCFQAKPGVDLKTAIKYHNSLKFPGFWLLQ